MLYTVSSSYTEDKSFIDYSKALDYYYSVIDKFGIYSACFNSYKVE